MEYLFYQANELARNILHTNFVQYKASTEYKNKYRNKNENNNNGERW